MDIERYLSDLGGLTVGSFMKISWPQAILELLDTPWNPCLNTMDNARKIQIFWVDAISRDNASLHQRVRRLFPFASFLFPRGVAVAAEKIHLLENYLALNSRITSIDIASRSRSLKRRIIRFWTTKKQVLQVSENNLSVKKKRRNFICSFKFIQIIMF